MRQVLGALVLTLLVAGCSSTSKVTGTNNGSGSTPITLAQGSMSATINDTSWVANTALAATYNNGLIAVSGADAAGLVLAFAAVASRPGTYAISPAVSTNAVMNQPNGPSWQAVMGIGSGSIVISTLTSTGAAGTFSFVMPAVSGSGATGTKTVTNGKFNVTF